MVSSGGGKQRRCICIHTIDKNYSLKWRRQQCCGVVNHKAERGWRQQMLQALVDLQLHVVSALQAVTIIDARHS